MAVRPKGLPEIRILVQGLPPTCEIIIQILRCQRTVRPKVSSPSPPSPSAHPTPLVHPGPMITGGPLGRFEHFDAFLMTNLSAS